MRACWIWMAIVTTSSVAEASTWTVCDSGCDFLDISSAVQAAGTFDGDIIEVSAGDYDGDVDIAKSVEVIGVDGRDVTFLYGGGSIHTTVFNGATVTMRGFTIGAPGTQRCVFVSQDSTLNLDDVQIQYCAIDAKGTGLMVNMGSTVNIVGSAFFSNDSMTAGGAHIQSEGTLSVTDTVFELGQSDLASGVYLEGGVAVFTDVSFVENDSRDQGGAIRIEDGALDCSNCSFYRNSALVDGGAISVGSSSGGTVSLTGGEFVENVSGARGGAVAYYAPTDLVIDEVIFVGNLAAGGGGAIAYDPDDDGVTLDITDSVFVQNSSEFNGGAVDVLRGGLATFMGNTFWWNTAVEDGGAARTEETDIQFVDNDFCMNDSGWAGGALYLRAPDGNQPALIANNRFVENQSIGAFGFGGALYLRLAQEFDISNNDFVGHDASLAGGTIRAQDVDTVRMRNNVIAWTAAASGVNGVNVAVGSDFDYNLWVDNLPDDASGDFTAGDLGSNALFVDPQYPAVSLDGVCGNDDFRPTANGPLVDAGDLLPVYYDPDGSRNDIGSYGGPLAPIYDLDGDGYDTLSDCDDDNPQANPGAAEIVGNEVDDDCDGSEDCYVDSDGDGYGSLLLVASADLLCDGVGEAPFSGDCDDADASNFPNNIEICDSADNDCDGNVDLGEVDWHADTDGDGFGDFASTLAVTVCSPEPAGYVLDDSDCDDGAVAVNPGGVEVCNGLDDDCDGLVDDGAVCPCDTYNEGASTYLYCLSPVDWATASSDCASMGYHLAVIGDVWEQNVLWATQRTYPFTPFWIGYDDIASEGVFVWDAADPGTGFEHWDVVNGEPNASGDCVYLKALGGYWRDTDCVNTYDYICEVECLGAVWYADLDGDGFGDPMSGIESCTRPAHTVVDDSDCDDSDPTIHSNGVETPADGRDGDCDGLEDCYLDADLDGHGDIAAIVVADPDMTCSSSGLSSTADDCDDGDPNISPTAFDLPGDGIDTDCDDFDSCYFDGDGDGYGDDGGVTIASTDADCNDLNESATGDDCNDNDAAFNPGAVEIPADIIDQNCDGLELCFTDEDDDDFGSKAEISTSDLTCSTLGLADDNLDCDDADPTVNPEAMELVGDEVDQDCDGTEVCYADVDGDTWGTTSTVVSDGASCAESGESTNDLDCDDADPLVNPGVEELTGDGVDGDCDGTEICFADADLDGFGADDGATVTSADLDCDDEGEGTTPDDCDDGDETIYPGAKEDLSKVDRDCDGFTDTTGEVGLAGCSCATGSEGSGWLGLLALLGLRRRTT